MNTTNPIGKWRSPSPSSRGYLAGANPFPWIVAVWIVALWVGAGAALPCSAMMQQETTHLITPADEESLSFERSARLVFKAHCFHCHGEAGTVEGHLDLRLAHLIRSGGDSGAAIEPGHPDQSYLLQRMVEGDMPPAEVTIRPSEKEIQIVRQWIADGANTARPEAEDPADLPRISPEDRDYWAFQPIAQVEIAPSQDPIDTLIARRLEPFQRTLSPPADRLTLIRRATFDLIGLPPTPEEVTAFLADESADAYSRLIDRLLDSPAYGQRWAKHWLDVAGYADSEGFNEADQPRPYGYKYRDYVIDAFNQDMPFDQFIIEQIAGDELITRSRADWTAEDQRRLIATGFLRNAPDGTGGEVDDALLAQTAVITETINIVSTSLMGMTVGCAQCHDHRFDPILHDDFYRLRAVFEPALSPQRWRSPSERLVTLLLPVDPSQTAEIETRIAAARAEFQAAESAAAAMVFEREILKIPGEFQTLGRAAYQRPETERSAEEHKVLADFPNLKVGRGTELDLYLELFDEGIATKQKLQALKNAIDAVAAELPQPDRIRALTEIDFEADAGEADAGEADSTDADTNVDPSLAGVQTWPETYIFHRGDPSQPTAAVPPGGLTVLAQDIETDFDHDDPALRSSGRRLAFARHLTDPAHPLTARVLVNRVWLHHFGRGLVATPGDFGRQGEAPSHPELLDYLARDFIDHRWQLKRLHRQIMLSATYRQSSLRHDDFDPANQWLARQSVRRLDAETIRDAILFVAGTLSLQLNGPAEQVQVTEEGQTVVSADQQAEAKSRRSIYVQHRRSTPLAMLEVFDAPRLEPNCTQRNVSTVTPQSLLLMNSQVLVGQSAAMADRVIDRVGDDPTQQVRQIWLLAFGAEPSQDEITEALEFLATQSQYFLARDKETGKSEETQTTESNAEPTDPDGADPEGADPEGAPRNDGERKITEAESAARSQALRSLCMVVLASNRFLYVD